MDFKECNKCFSDNKTVCRRRGDPTESFCCNKQSNTLSVNTGSNDEVDEDRSNRFHNCTTDPGQPDLELKENGKFFELCSHEMLPEEFLDKRAFACPYSPDVCDLDSPVVYMDPLVNNKTLLSVS